MFHKQRVDNIILELILVFFKLGRTFRNIAAKQK